MPTTPGIIVRARRAADEAWAARLLATAWGSTRVVTRGQLHTTMELPALVAELDGVSLGLLTYHIEGEGCEIVTLNAEREGSGLGTALLERALELARAADCERLWLITSNDNLPALRFYQKRGFKLVAVHRGAIDAARELKPEIPQTGLYGIPLRDEIELERHISAAPET